MMVRSLLFLSVLLCACEAPNSMLAAPMTEPGTLAPMYGEAAVLELLNDPGTTHGFLDEDVGINRRAASSLIAYRNGDDGVYGSADDNLFGSLPEVDGVRYVGPVTIDQIRAFAMAHGWGE